ncbi:glycosyltransferase family 2 protein [Roseomonas sp. 18066]|uniref:glycosyltransferase family 2 protein n=1 Tax=Roseomonas sp. 18066 TaxID=2681412 RepID=UPI00135C87D9|nr:glycosyltransferase family 2 protein [Roseomonas sp. 18066]
MTAIAAGIVLFHPDPDALAETLAALAPDVAALYLFLNAPADEALRACLRRPLAAPVILMNDGRNLGLGTAYNRMAAAARAGGHATLLLLDQDSTPPPGMARHLQAAHRRLREAGECPAVIGPHPVAAGGSATKTPRLFLRHGSAPVDGARPLEFLISSGSLLDLAAFEAIGGFRDDFFIDAVDIEWCFRAWARHFSCWMLPGLAMPHRLGQGLVRVPLIGLQLARQPCFRLYTYARNQTAMLRLDHVPLRWKLKLFPYIAIQAAIHCVVRRDTAALRAFARGIADGLARRMGPVRHRFVG